jgi:sec-independent protein translocase protein TatB
MDIFGIGTAEFFLILIISFMVLGPRRLPQYAAKAGKLFRDLRNMSYGLITEWQRELAVAARLDELEETRQELLEAQQMLKETRQSLSQETAQIASEANQAVADTSKVIAETAPEKLLEHDGDASPAEVSASKVEVKVEQPEVPEQAATGETAETRPQSEAETAPTQPLNGSEQSKTTATLSSQELVNE